jgi:hypothetical protein
MASLNLCNPYIIMNCWLVFWGESSFISNLSDIRQVHSQSSSSVICHTTGPQPLPKRFPHIMRSRASSFKWEYPLLSPRSSSNCLRLPPRLLVTSIRPFIFPSITSFRRQFLRKMDGCGKPRPHQNPILGPSGPERIAISTAISGLTQLLKTAQLLKHFLAVIEPKISLPVQKSSTHRLLHRSNRCFDGVFQSRLDIPTSPSP